MVKLTQIMEDKTVDEEIKNTAENSPSNDEENKSTISSDLIRGHINTIILRTLYERDKYGYEIIEEIESKSHGQYSLKQPTLYSALKRLESQGYINAYWKTDEVSQGGRRKYYTLTESGKEIAEKNQAEWEYSRTVIDSLISDRNFDFSQPAPSSVDFKILKKSTTRVPTGNSEHGDGIENENNEAAYTPSSTNGFTASYESTTVVYEDAPPVAAAPAAEVSQPAQVSETVNEQAPVTDNSVAVQPAERQAAGENSAPVQTEMSEEERRIVHENYLRLISEPVEQPVEETPTAPFSDDIDTEKLIYINKPETERDYRNLINNLFVKTIKPQPEPRASAAATSSSPAERKINGNGGTPTVRYEDAAAKANSDGLTVNTSNFESAGSRRKRYNLGANLFKSSLIVAVVMLLEFALTLIFKKDLAVSYAYPFVILALAVAQVLIFGVIRAMNVGKNSTKPASLTYLTASIIVTVIIILIIFVTAILLNVDFSSAADVMAKIIIPIFVSLNIPLFTTLFCLFSK